MPEVSNNSFRNIAGDMSGSPEKPKAREGELGKFPLAEEQIMIP